MAKRSNNIRNKRSITSKPYDVSNSFVKKVASRVSELLPQSIWPTKWFSSTTNEVPPQGRGRDALNSPIIAEEDTNECPIPLKRARMPLNSTFSEPPIESTNPDQDFETRRLRHPLPSIDVTEDGLDEPVAGPSGLQRHYSPMGNTESSVLKPRDSLIYAAKKREVNGEDHSDSSESTSGCSSLPLGDQNTEMRSVGQPQSKEPQVECAESGARASAKRRYSEAANYNSMAANSSRLFSGLRGYSPPNRASPLPVGRRRKPSFNPDAFGLQNWSGEKTNIKDRIVNSPFYSGRTTYGGVSAYQNSLKKTENQTLPRRKSIQVQPRHVSESRENSTSMSSTARRIMEALEMFSSPIQDAKKIPLDESIHIKRRKVLVNPDFTQSFSHSSQSSLITMQDSTTRRLGEVPPPVKELTIPTVPDILAMRRLQRLQGSTVAARQSACEKMMRPPSVEKDNHSDYLHPYPDIRNSGRVGGKIKSNEEIDEEPVEEVNLPNIALPITSLPKFDFIVPPACPPQSALKIIDSQSVSKQINSLSFKFSSPIAFSGASELLTTSNSFTFSSPLKALSKDELVEDSPKVSPCSSTNNIKSASSNINDKLSSHVKGRSSSIEKLPPLEPIWPNKGKGLNVHRDGSGAKKGADKVQVSSGNSLLEKSSFGDEFKPAAGSWECDTCMVRNNNDVSKCVACETQRSSVAGDTKSTKGGHTVSSGFGSSFKPPSGSWTCDTCLVQNPSTTDKCLACETPKPNAQKDTSANETLKADNNVAVSGFGDKFKKPSGDWDCSICLVRNKAGGPLKCVACEAPKPGTEAPSSGPKLTFGSPVVSGFNFGIDKANLPKKDETAETTKPSFTFGNASSVPAGGFTFGVNNASEVPKSNDVGVIFGSASVADTTDSSKKLTASEGTPTFSFGVRGSYENIQKTASVESAGVQPSKDVKDDSIKATKAKDSTESGDKFTSGFASNSSLPGFVMPAVTAKPLTTSDAKSTSPFESPDNPKREPATASAPFSFGGNSAVTKTPDSENKSPSTAFSSPSSTANTKSVFGSGWAGNSPFKLDSSPKASIFSKATSPLGSLGKSDDKIEDSNSPGTSAFKFGGTSKNESTINKVPELPSAVSSNFKFQEPPKTTAAFKFEETSKPISVASPSAPTSTFTSNPFSSGGFGSANKEKLPASGSFSSTSSVPASMPSPISADSSTVKPSNTGLFTFGKPSTSEALSTTSVSSNSSVTKTGNTGLFMFGSGNSSQATAFDVTKQKQSVPNTSSTISTEPAVPPLMSSARSTPLFGDVLSKPSLYGSQSTAPSPSSVSSLLTTTKSEALSSSNNVFASPAANSMFGSSVSSSAPTTTAPVATTIAGSSSGAFGSSIFGAASTSFSAIGSSAPAPAFGSSTTTPLAPPPAFGVRQSAPSGFGIGSSASAATPFSFTAKPVNEEQQRTPASNAPFVFGGGAAAPAAQPFNFNAAPNKPPFSFGSSAVGSQPVIGAGAPPPVASTAPGGFSFGDVSKRAMPFGSSPPTTSIAGGTANPFGSNPTAPVASVTPAAPTFGAPLGESNAAAGGAFGSTPAFNFGSSQSNPVFAFSNNQANAAPAPAFNFGQAPQQSAAPQVTFNPNMPPSFNFTGGATPQFTATPGSLGSVPAANPMQRRIKKAVRRSQQPR